MNRDPRDLDGIISEYVLSEEVFSVKGLNDNNYNIIKKACGYCFSEHEVQTYFGSVYSEETGSLDLIYVDLSFVCRDCNKTNNHHDKALIKGKCKGCNEDIQVSYHLSDLHDMHPVFMEEIKNHGFVIFENPGNSNCVSICSNYEGGK